MVISDQHEIAFKEPVNLKQLEQMVHNSVGELGLVADWVVEFKLHYDGKNKEHQVGCESARGFICAGCEQLMEFSVASHVDYGTEEPAFGRINFNPVCGLNDQTQRYETNIGKVYRAFEGNYNKIAAAKESK